MVNITLVIIKEEKDKEQRIKNLKQRVNLNQEECIICLNKLCEPPPPNKKEEMNDSDDDNANISNENSNKSDELLSKPKNNIVFGLPCTKDALHIFHRDCITQWLTRKNECPLCKFKFDGAYKCYDVKFDDIE